MPAVATTAPPTAVPNEMPMLNAMGSSELARVSALGWRLFAIRMNSEMHDTEARYISRPTAKMRMSAAGMAAPTAHRQARVAACSAKVSTSARMPKRASIQPPRIFEMSVKPP